MHVCMERVKLNGSASKFYCCPIALFFLLYTLFTYISLTSYQLERQKNTAFPEGTAKTPFSTRTGKKNIARKMSGRQRNSFLLSKLPICKECQPLRKAVDGRTHKMKKMLESHRHSQHFH